MDLAVVGRQPRRGSGTRYRYFAVTAAGMGFTGIQMLHEARRMKSEQGNYDWKAAAVRAARARVDASAIAGGVPSETVARYRSFSVAHEIGHSMRTAPVRILRPNVRVRRHGHASRLSSRRTRRTSTTRTVARGPSGRQRSADDEGEPRPAEPGLTPLQAYSQTYADLERAALERLDDRTLDAFLDFVVRRVARAVAGRLEWSQ